MHKDNEIINIKIHNKTPIFSLLNIYLPIKQIINAGLGMVEVGNIISASFFDIIPFSYSCFVYIAPTGNPEIEPISIAPTAYGFLFNFCIGLIKGLVRYRSISRDNSISHKKTNGSIDGMTFDETNIIFSSTSELIYSGDESIDNIKDENRKIYIVFLLMQMFFLYIDNTPFSYIFYEWEVRKYEKKTGRQNIERH